MSRSLVRSVMYAPAMRRVAAMTSSALFALVATTAAGQDVCAEGARVEGPLSASRFDADWGVAQRACPRDGITLGAQGLAVVDLPRRYGAARTAGYVRLGARLADPEVEGFVALEPVRHQLVIRSFQAETLGVGHVSWGAIGRVLHREGWALSVSGRIALPASNDLYDATLPVHLDLGLTAAHLVDARLRAHAWVLGSSAASFGEASDLRVGARLGGGLDWRPLDWLDVIAELVFMVGDREGLTGALAQAGLRVTFDPAGSVELSASVPWLGPRSLEQGATTIAAHLSWTSRWR